MNKKQWIIVILIFILAIFLRIFNWPNNINDVNCDEAMLAINAKSIVDSGKDIYGTSYPVYFESWGRGGQSALPTYLVALCIKLFGYSLFSVRLPILFITLTSLIVMFLFSYKAFKNKNISIIIIILLAINPWDIVQSQWNLDCNLFPHLILIAIYLLYIGIEEKKDIQLYISMLFFALCLYSYGIALYTVPIFLFLTAIFCIKNKKITISKIVCCIVIFIICSIPIILMTILNMFNIHTINIGNMTIQNFEYVTRQSDMLIFSNNKINTLVSNMKSMFTVIIFQYDNNVFSAFKWIGTTYLISIPFFILGIISSIVGYNDKKDKFAKNIIINWLLVSIIAGVLINNINISRLNIIWYPLIIFSGLGIYELVENVKIRKFTIPFISIIYIISFGYFLYYYNNIGINKIINSYTWSKGLVSAINEANNKETSRIMISNNVCNTDKKDVFIRYATKFEKEKYFINNKEFSYYFREDKKPNMNFSTRDKKYIIINIDENNYLTEKLYVIDKKEKEKIVNIEDYKEEKHNNYIVLIKK